MSFDPTTVAQTIEGVLRYRPQMTGREIAEVIFGDQNREGDISKDLEWLWRTKIIGRNPDGSYFPARDGPTNLNANQHVKSWI